MGRHSRRGPAPKGDAADTTARRSEQQGTRPGDGGDIPVQSGGQPRLPGQRQGSQGQRPVPQGRRQAPMGGAGAAAGHPPRAPQGPATFPDGTPVHGVPRLGDGLPPRGVSGFGEGTPAHGVPRLPDGTPGHGVPRLPDGTPTQGVPRLADGTPAHGVPRFGDGTPAHGMPRRPDGTSAHGAPRLHEGAPARGGHPEQREAGGGWGQFAGASGPGGALPQQRPAGQGSGTGPRQEYLDAFADGRAGALGAEDDVDVFAPRVGKPRPAEQHPTDAPEADGHGDSAPPGARGTARATAPQPQPLDGGTAPQGTPRARTFTGIAAAAVTTVLAVVVAGQVTESRDGGSVPSHSATDQARDAGPGGQTPSASPGTTTLSYEQKMGRTYPLSATMKGPGKFDAVPGFAKAPGKGQKYTYRVDVEQGLGLDGELFAEAVQKTLNDDRSWAHGGARTFERISSGKPDFVITLASPGTTAKWCAKSGLDTTEDNVSCDSAATERVMINAYRWAQGSKTYGDKIHAYRLMLINHEVGHRLGHGHVTCQKDGELAPVMQQQTKFLNHDGIHCLPNPWPYPTS
ncbi:DUF3152 domain-containing protein [Streptomyces sp. NPDC053069]|uniref:DUF3152 domain-containing protein n=1 Tax=Streptomyces sp. NPDC053069 TaxID=3365695 RepID=UPI0037CD4D26